MLEKKLNIFWIIRTSEKVKVVPIEIDIEEPLLLSEPNFRRLRVPIGPDETGTGVVSSVLHSSFAHLWRVWFPPARPRTVVPLFKKKRN